MLDSLVHHTCNYILHFIIPLPMRVSTVTSSRLLLGSSSSFQTSSGRHSPSSELQNCPCANNLAALHITQITTAHGTLAEDPRLFNLADSPNNSTDSLHIIEPCWWPYHSNLLFFCNEPSPEVCLCTVSTEVNSVQ